MPRRMSPHSIVDYRNEAYTNDYDYDNMHESNLVDDDHYISLQLHEENDDHDEDYQNHHHRFVPSIPSRAPSQLTGVQQMDVNERIIDNNDRTAAIIDYSQFDISAPVWGPNKRESVILSICGSISIIVGVLCCVCGVLDFVMESYASEASLQVESKFGMMVIVFGGLAACKAASRLRATSLACVFGFSLLGVGAGLCDASMQWLNQYYVKDPLEKGIDVSILIFSMIGAISSLTQICVALSITSSSIEQGSRGSAGASSGIRTASSGGESPMMVARGRRLGLFLGLTQSILGVIITSLTVGVYTALETKGPILEIRNGTNGTYAYRQWSQGVKWTLSSELTNHGFLIAAAGVSVALSALHSTKWTRLVCLSLQGVALVTTVCNHVHSLANIYAAPAYADLDVKLSVVQLLAYMLVIGLAAYSFVNCINRVNGGENLLNTAIRELVQKQGWRLYSHTALIQLLLASLYFIVWVAGFGERYLYLLDFTPLPVLILLHSVLSYSLARSFSALMLMLNLAWVLLCGVYAVRDLYLFDYHAASKHPQDRPWWPKHQNESFPAAMPIVSKVGVHLLLAAVALMETVFSGVLILMYLRSLGATIGIIIPNKLQHKHVFRGLAALGGLQLASAALVVNFGFILFLSNLFTVEYLGDVCTFLGFLLLATGACTFLSARFSPVFLPLAAIMNALAFVVLWQHTDGNGLLFSLIILYYKGHEDIEQHRAYTFSAVTFALCLFCQLLCGLSLIGLEDVLIDAKFDSSVRIEMMVRNAEALEDISLAVSSAANA